MTVDYAKSQSNAKLAVLYEGKGEFSDFQRLADKLAINIYQEFHPDISESYFLSRRDNVLQLIDKQNFDKNGIYVDIFPRQGEQHSFPSPKKGPLAQAIGRKTQSVIDATTGWAQDSLHLFRMGYHVLCIERSLVMAELIKDGLARLSQQRWFTDRNIQPPCLMTGNSIDLLKSLDFVPDCIYLDPMFPPKRKKSALAKKSMMLLRELLGNDEDIELLFETALQIAGKRVVVKRPDYAEPLGNKPNESFQGKLLRYDVYFKAKWT